MLMFAGNLFYKLKSASKWKTAKMKLNVSLCRPSLSVKQFGATMVGFCFYVLLLFSTTFTYRHLHTVDTLLQTLPKNWMNGISGWGSETTDCLSLDQGSKTAEMRVKQTGLRKGLQEMGSTSLRKRVATSMSMQMALWKPRALWILLGRGCLSGCWLLYCLLQWANTWYLSENIPGFLKPCESCFSSMGSSCHQAVLMPQLCR